MTWFYNLKPLLLNVYLVIDHLIEYAYLFHLFFFLVDSLSFCGGVDNKQAIMVCAHTVILSLFLGRVCLSGQLLYLGLCQSIEFSESVKFKWRKQTS